MPKEMFAATPPRRISSVCARKLTEILSSWSTTSESAKRPEKVMRWSVAMDPAMAMDTRVTIQTPSVRDRTYRDRHSGTHQPPVLDIAGYRSRRSGYGRSRPADAQGGARAAPAQRARPRRRLRLRPRRAAARVGLRGPRRGNRLPGSHPSGAGRPPRVLPAAQPVRSGAEVLPDHRCRAGRPRGPARLLGAPAARRDGRDHTHHDTGGHRMRTTDRIRLEHAVQRYDFWLDMRGVSMRRRRELRRELRTNLAEATADVGMTRAIFGIGSPKELAHAATENDPS